jgi:hypothetical protein
MNKERRKDEPIINSNNFPLQSILLVGMVIPKRSHTHDNLTNTHRGTRKQNIIPFEIIQPRLEFYEFFNRFIYFVYLLDCFGKEIGIEDSLEIDGGC